MGDNDPSMQDAMARLQPVAPGERIFALDAIRGLAIFGVLLAYALWSLGSPPQETYGTADKVLEWVLSALVDMKFYTLFAFLFGLGFSIQLTRAEARGTSVVPTYCRRLFALLLIGLAHALLLRNGDILVPYAVMGFILLLFRNAPNGTLAVVAIVGLFLPYLARGAWELSGIPFPERPTAPGGGYLAENVAWVRFWYTTAITSWPASLPMFMFGLYLGRRRFFDEIDRHRRTLRIVLVVGLCIGVLAFAARALFVMGGWFAPTFLGRMAFGLLGTLHAWGLAAFYASSLTLLVQREAWARRLVPLAAAGRMALTNYLLQATILVPVCVAFGLFDTVTPSLGLLLAVVVWSVQVPFSVWWLKRFRFGPAEWVWRSIAYGRAQPMRVVREQVAVASA